MEVQNAVDAVLISNYLFHGFLCFFVALLFTSLPSGRLIT